MPTIYRAGNPVEVVRPPRIAKEIEKLLATGTAVDLLSELGQTLSEFFTAEEWTRARQLSIPDGVPGWDGVTCNFCRGSTRFADCPNCHGSFALIESDPVPVIPTSEI